MRSNPLFRSQVQAQKEEVKRKLRERRVPSSPIGRAAGFAQLGASLVYGTISDSISNYMCVSKLESSSEGCQDRRQHQA